MTWNYRITTDGEYYYVRDCYYNEHKQIWAWCEEPRLIGESVEELLEEIEQIKSDILRCKDDIISEENFQFAELDELDLSDVTEEYIERMKGLENG